MPRTPIDYSKTLIYKLVHKDDYNNANIYIGSTTDFTRRKNEHKRGCNNEKDKDHNAKKYQYIRENGGWDIWEMVEVEKYNCNDGNEARAREEYWRSHFNAKLNAIRAYITEEQRLEYHTKQMNERYENNKDKISEQQKERYENNKQPKREYYETHKSKILEQQKERYENNKDKILEQQKERYNQNKDKILEQMKQQITCECGCIVRNDGLATHRKSQKHLLLTKQIKYEFVDDSD